MPTPHYMKRRHLKENGIKLPWAIGSKVPSSQTCNATEKEALSGVSGSSSKDNQIQLESKLDLDQSEKDRQLHEESHAKMKMKVNGNAPSTLQLNLHRESELLDSHSDRQSSSIATKGFTATGQLKLLSSRGGHVVCKDGCMPSVSKTALSDVPCLERSKGACGTTAISKNPPEPTESSKTYGGKKNGTEQVRHSSAFCPQSLCASYGLEQSKAYKASNDRFNTKQNEDAAYLTDLGLNTRQANHSSEGPPASRLTFDRVSSRLDALGFEGGERSNHSRGKVTNTSRISEHSSSALGKSEKYGQQQMNAFIYLEPETIHRTAESIDMSCAPTKCRESDGDNDATAHIVLVPTTMNKSKGSSPVTTSCSKAPPKLSLAPDTTVHDTMGVNANHSQVGDNCDNKASNTDDADALNGSKRSSFAERLERLKAYKAKHGHLNVKKSKDKALAGYFHNIIHACRHPEKTRTVTEEMIQSLDEIGLDWSTRQRGKQKSFEERLDELRSYKAKNGHLSVSGQSEDKSLYNFCAKLRVAYRKHSRGEVHKGGMKLTAQRIEQLNALGFDWAANKVAKTFEERVEELKAFKAKQGHLNVQHGADQSLYRFCTNIRSSYRHPDGKHGRKKLNREQIDSLDSIGFIWKLY